MSITQFNPTPIEDVGILGVVNETVGVSYDKRSSMYVAALRIDRVFVLRKLFDTYNDAVICRKNAEKHYNIEI